MVSAGARNIMAIHVKRIYEPPEPKDGFRILVDRLWPRGISKSAAHIDLWHKDAAPSTELRKWFAHDPSKWTEFQERYLAELAHNPDALNVLVEHARRGDMTLLYGAKDETHNHAVVLKAHVEKLGKRSAWGRA